MINKKTIKPGEMLAPVPAVMVTVGDMEKSNIITIAWTGIVNSNPPYTYVSVRKERYSHDIIEESGEFVINLTTEKIANATDFCGVKSGRDVDKFEETGLTKVEATEVKCPLIAEAPVNLECKVFQKIEFPTHDMFLAEIVAVHVNEDLFDEKGRIELEKAGLISYVHGEYYGIKRNPLGFFGYSIAKAKTLKKKSKEYHEKRVNNNKEKRESSKSERSYSKREKNSFREKKSYTKKDDNRDKKSYRDKEEYKEKKTSKKNDFFKEREKFKKNRDEQDKKDRKFIPREKLDKKNALKKDEKKHFFFYD